MSSFRERVLSGSTWNVGASLTGFAFDFVVSVVLARLLTPADFGLVAVAMVAARFVAVLGNVGVGQALVQREHIDDTHVATVFWLSMLANCLIAMTIVLTAPATAAFYEEPRLTAITRVIAIQFPIAGFSVVPRALLQREVRFSSVAKVDVLASIVSGVSAVGMAVLGAGVWSIALRGLIEQMLAICLFVRVRPYRPSLHASAVAARQLFRFSAAYYVDQFLKFVSRNLDTVIIGRLLGSNALGLYNRAYSLMMLPLTTVAQSLFSVFFSAFSAVQNDDSRIARIHQRATGMLALVFVPAMFGLMSVAEPAVLVIFGEPWRGMIPVVRILSPAGIWHVIFGIYQSVYMAKGRTDLQLKYTFVGRAFVLAGIVAGVPFGIRGVAVGFALGSAVDAFVNTYVAGRLIGLPLTRQLRVVAVVLAAGVVMSVAVIGADLLLTGRWPALPRLAVLVSLGGAVYLLQLVMFRPAAYLDAKDLLVSRVRELRARRSAHGA